MGLGRGGPGLPLGNGADSQRAVDGRERGGADGDFRAVHRLLGVGGLSGAPSVGGEWTGADASAADGGLGGSRGVYRGAVHVLSAHPPGEARDERSLLGSVVVTGVTLAIGLGMAGLVVAADAGKGRHVLLRRVLDGVVTAGAVFMTGWVLLRGASDGWRLGTGMVGVLWTAEVVFLSFLFALRRLVRSDQRVTLWVGIGGLSLMLIGDTLRLWTVGPHSPEAMSCQLADACSTAGLLVVAVGPWVPGGASVLGAAQPTLRWGIEGAAAFIPLTVCTVTALGYVLAPPARDPVPLLVGGIALLSLWARQTFLSSENTRNDD